jgi:hypothetical protein
VSIERDILPLPALLAFITQNLTLILPKTSDNQNGSQLHFPEYSSPLRKNSDFPASIYPAGLNSDRVNIVDGI